MAFKKSKRLVLVYLYNSAAPAARLAAGRKNPSARAQKNFLFSPARRNFLDNFPKNQFLIITTI